MLPSLRVAVLSLLLLLSPATRVQAAPLPSRRPRSGARSALRRWLRASIGARSLAIASRFIEGFYAAGGTHASGVVPCPDEDNPDEDDDSDDGSGTGSLLPIAARQVSGRRAARRLVAPCRLCFAGRLRSAVCVLVLVYVCLLVLDVEADLWDPENLLQRVAAEATRESEKYWALRADELVRSVPSVPANFTLTSPAAWLYYSLGDQVSGNYPKTAAEAAKQFPGSITAEYLQRTQGEMFVADIPALSDIIETRAALRSDLSGPSTVVLHVRAGDVMGISNDATDESSRKKAVEFLSHQQYQFSYKKSYVRPLEYWAMALRDVRSLNITHATIVSGAHHPCAGAPCGVSYFYLLALKAFCTGIGLQTTLQLPVTSPDDGIVHMVSAHYYVPSGGGFSALVVAARQLLGRAVLQPPVYLRGLLPLGVPGFYKDVALFSPVVRGLVAIGLPLN